jgi:hypothetical protein
MTRRCHGRSKKKLKVKNWKETAKGRRTWKDLAEKAENPQRVVVPNDDEILMLWHLTVLTHCGRVTQICVFNTVKFGTSASSP